MKTLKINTSHVVKLFSLTLFLCVLAGLQNVSAQLFYSNFEGSQVKISGSRNNAQFAPVTNHFTCEGKFTMINGQLEYLDALKFTLPLNAQKESALVNNSVLNTAKPQNDINFVLTHSMVLPILNVIHAIGYLDIQGVKTRVDFHLDYIENSSETITVLGKRSIRLSDYKKGAISVFADAKTQDIVNLDLKLIIKNPAKADFIAAVK